MCNREEKFSPSEAARMIGVGEKLLTSWAHERERTGREIGPRVSLIRTGGKIYRVYEKSAIEEFLDEAFTEAPAGITVNA